MSEIVIGLCQWLAECGDQAAGQTRSGRNRNLLSQHRTDRQFESVPGAWDAQSRPRFHQRRQRRIFGEMGGDGKRIGCQIEHA